MSKNQKRKFARFFNLPYSHRSQPELEDVYRYLFVRDLKKIGLEDIYYPVGSAANYSLLYIILRVAKAVKPRNVLDVGAGQSSLLLDALRKAGMAENVTTLESDADWATEIGGRVSHKVIHSPLTLQRISGIETLTYDWSLLSSIGPFDVIVCDGPWGVKRYSRFGVCEAVGKMRADDFCCIIDDSERPGELDTVDSVDSILRSDNCAYRTGIIRGATVQTIFAGGNWQNLAYF